MVLSDELLTLKLMALLVVVWLDVALSVALAVIAWLPFRTEALFQLIDHTPEVALPEANWPVPMDTLSTKNSTLTTP